MASKRVDPGAAEGQQSGVYEQPGDPDTHDERVGPLRLERLRKADGRALILYTATAEPE